MSFPDFPRNASHWNAGTDLNNGRWWCISCGKGWMNKGAADRHELTETHQTNASIRDTFRQNMEQGSSSRHLDEALERVMGPLDFIIGELQRGPQAHVPYFPDRSDPPQPEPEYDYQAIGEEAGEFLPTYQENVVSELAKDLQQFLHYGPEDDSDSEDDFQAELNERDEREADPLATEAAPPRDRQGRQVSEIVNPAWFPYESKIHAVLDIMRHLPRSLFSDTQMDIIVWMLRTLEVPDVPSVDVLKEIDSLLQSHCGLETKRCKGRLGNIFYVNNLASIIAQDFSNPRIRPHIHAYPQDSGKTLGECRQAQHWLNGIDPTLATPMIRVHYAGGSFLDYYIHEPARLRDGRIVIPERWLTKVIDGREVFFGRAMVAYLVRGNDGSHQYLIHEFEKVEVPASDFLSNFKQLEATYLQDGLPNPRHIAGIRKVSDGPVEQWAHADGNQWREKAKGHRVLAYTMWMYCDDTSGNVSKKWNKHNSFLFTAAGLPRTMSQKEQNIHFLCTSNIAPPLEMLDAIVDQLEDAQTHGIWAYDYIAEEMVLVVPAVLALLGDNPMQSELACHVGLNGKFFCRNCWVKGRDVEDEVPQNPQANTSNPGSPVGSEASGGSAGGAPKKRGRRKETIQEMVDRAHRFLGDIQPRVKSESLQSLQSMFVNVSTINSKRHYNEAKTNSGLKDNMLEFFAQKVFKYTSFLRGPQSAKQQVLNEMLSREIPDDPFSPVWRIKGLDPHKDTPVEILHVILLGFIKYFWRDAINRLNDDQKELLKIRIDSLDLSGLSLPYPLSGHTCVRYAGSLVGRDFRAISQIAPFVLYDLIPENAYNAWLALSALVPLVWQPYIEDIDKHIEILEAAIDHFLISTARWTPRWFNKPKFHIIRHLPPHIRRFGPAMLFATEAFESFNAVIRDFSVHSNHAAPSRDIARGMARGARVRHILSGGYFMIHRDQAETPVENDGFRPTPYSDDKTAWKTAGPATLALARPGVSLRNPLAERLGFLVPETPKAAGSCVHISNAPARVWTQTATYKQFPNAFPNPEASRYRTCKSVLAENMDDCLVGGYVLVTNPDPHSRPLVGRIREILQIMNSASAGLGMADFVLIDVFNITATLNDYNLPSLSRRGCTLLSAKTVLCPVNVQHNCKQHQCRPDASVPVLQEREATGRTKKRILHRVPEDIMLNTAKLRDAVYVQQFRILPVSLDKTSAIYNGAIDEFESQKAEAGSGETASRPRQRAQRSKRGAGSLLYLTTNKT